MPMNDVGNYIWCSCVELSNQIEGSKSLGTSQNEIPASHKLLFLVYEEPRLLFLSIIRQEGLGLALGKKVEIIVY